MAEGPFGMPRPFVNPNWPFRQPTAKEIDEIKQYHIEELNENSVVVGTNISKQDIAVLEQFSSDNGYGGKIAIAFPDQIDKFTIYWWPHGQVNILTEREGLNIDTITKLEEFK